MVISFSVRCSRMEHWLTENLQMTHMGGSVVRVSTHAEVRGVITRFLRAHGFDEAIWEDKITCPNANGWSSSVTISVEGDGEEFVRLCRLLPELDR